MENNNTQIVEEQQAPTQVIEEQQVSTTPSEEQTTNDVPFKVFKTQEEFDNHAGYIKKSTTSSILKELGIDDKSQLDELKNSIKAALDTNDELIKVKEASDEQLRDLQLDNFLLKKGIQVDNLDYVKLDIAKNKINIDDETTFNDFISNSKWVSKTNEQQVETIIDTQSKGLESLSEVEAFRLKQFLK